MDNELSSWRRNGSKRGHARGAANRVDMADAESIAAGYATVNSAWGRVNVLVHTVGPSAGPFEELDDDDWHAAFDLGTMAAVRSVRAALPMLRAADWARIVTLSAHSIQRQSARLVAYTATKAALSSFTKNLSKSLGPEGILVNCVCPGTIVTASFTEILKDDWQRTASILPILTTS